MNAKVKNLLEVGIVLTAHPKQQKWWPPVLLSLEQYPGPLFLSYDDIDVEPIPAEILSRFREVNCTLKAPGILGHGLGELICMKMGFDAACRAGIEYCLKLGFDEPPWRWRYLLELKRQLDQERLDIIDCQTRVIFGRTKKLMAVMDAYDLTKREKGAAESYWRAVVKEKGFRVKRIESRQYWEDNLGIRHLQGEYAANIGLPNSWCWTIGEIYPRVKNE